MSDLGTLSSHYRSSAELAKELNQAVVIMKKKFYKLAGEQDISEEQIASCRRYLANVLNTLLIEFTSASGEDNKTVQQSIPASILERVRQAHKGTLAHYIEDVTEVKNRLLQDGIGLTEEDIHLLDELAATAGLDTSEVFRKMWRKR